MLLLDLQGQQLDDLSMILTSFVTTQLKAISAKKEVLKKLPRMYIYSLNRVLLGASGATKELLENSLQGLADKFFGVICGASKDQILKQMRNSGGSILPVNSTFANEVDDPPPPDNAAPIQLPPDPTTTEVTPSDSDNEVRRRRKREAASDSKQEQTTDDGKSFTHQAALDAMQRLLGYALNPEARDYMWVEVFKKKYGTKPITKSSEV